MNALEQKVMQALADNPRVAADEVAERITDAIVAVAAATRTPGVTSVNDEIRIGS
jgi:hypothetical protein